MLNVAVVGAGGWGRNLVRVMSQLDGCELRIICDSNREVLAAQQKLHPQARCTPSVDDVLADPAIDAVVVAVDARNHFTVARAALTAGKHVLVEKPLTLEVAHSAELIRLAERVKKKLMVGHLLLYHPVLEKAKRLCDAGELGPVHYLYSQRLNLGIVRSDENAWWSLAPHDISVALWLFDAQPVSVSATGATYLQQTRGIEDVVFATLRFADGRLAHIHVSWLDPHKMRKLTVVGANKMLVFDDTAADEKLRIYDKGATPRPGYVSYEDGVAVRTGSVIIPSVSMREPLALECAEFRDCIVEDRSPRSSGHDGLAVVRVLAAGEASLRAGGAVIPLDPAALPRSEAE